MRPSLPLQPSPLIGRDSDLRSSCNLARGPGARLITFLGPAGVGKTRLAIATAERLADESGDETVFVDLSAISDPALVVGAIASHLAVHARPDEPLLATLVSAIGGRHLVLVLDNWEHVLDAAPMVAELLAECAGLRVLATSRAPLQLRWEHRFSVESLSPTAAVSLFIERARASHPSFQLMDAQAPVLYNICKLLDCLPLAIELAATRVATVPLSELAAALTRGLDVLVSDLRDLPPRERSLRAALRWSYDLLTPAQQHLLRITAVAPGSCALEALRHLANADAVASSTADADIAVLTESSLLRREHLSGGRVRLRLQDSLRTFVLDEANALGERQALQGHHAAWLATLAETAELQLRSGARSTWLTRLDDERDNIRAALTWCSASSTDVTAGLRLAAALEWYWHFRNLWTEGYRWVLALRQRADPTAAPWPWAKASYVAGRLAVFLGECDTAGVLLEQSVTAFWALGDTCSAGFALCYLARLHGFQGTDHARAWVHAAEAADLFASAGDDWGLALARFYCADALLHLGRLAEARDAAEASATLFRGVADDWGMGLALEPLYAIAMAQGDLPAARAAAEEMLTIHRSAGEVYALTGALLRRAYVARHDADSGLAASHYTEVLKLTAETPYALHAAPALVGLVALTLRRRHRRLAAHLISAYDVVRARGDPTLVETTTADFNPDVHSIVRSVRRGSDGPSTTDEITWRALSYDALIERAIALTAGLRASTADDARDSTRLRPRARGSLTARETEVLRLLAAGRSNREMAASLVLSVRTVEKHIESVYSKLGITRRAKATAVAIDMGLTPRVHERTRT